MVKDDPDDKVSSGMTSFALLIVQAHRKMMGLDAARLSMLSQIQKLSSLISDSIKSHDRPVI